MVSKSIENTPTRGRSRRKNIISFTIEGTLPGLNEIIDARIRIKRQRHLWNGYTEMKRRIDSQIVDSLRISKVPAVPEDWYPVVLEYRWIEPNRRRDKGNIRGGEKFVSDALVEAGILAGDGWKYVAYIVDRFDVDKTRPRVEVSIYPEKR